MTHVSLEVGKALTRRKDSLWQQLIGVTLCEVSYSTFFKKTVLASYEHAPCFYMSNNFGKLLNV